MISSGGQFTALFDANALFSPLLTDLALELAIVGVYRPRWSERIHDEWIAAVLQARPGVAKKDLERRREMMDQAFRDACVEIVAEIRHPMLPDPADQHVLTAALIGRANVIVTDNLRHFPATVLHPLGLEAQSLNHFLTYAPDVHHLDAVSALRNVIARRLKPAAWTSEQMALELESRGKLLAAAEVRELLGPRRSPNHSAP